MLVVPESVARSSRRNFWPTTGLHAAGSTQGSSNSGPAPPPQATAVATHATAVAALSVLMGRNVMTLLLLPAPLSNIQTAGRCPEGRHRRVVSGLAGEGCVVLTEGEPDE